ncbi:MAG: c-type cytochrome [Myxococcota bacterium]|nr:c-type cytochrome [Myxococcota bacterium]
MKISKVTLAAVLAVAVGCGQRTAATYTGSSGSLALSRDDAFLYAVDSDNDLLVVLETETDSVVAKVTVGRAPERVAVGPDDTIYVSNRGNRSVSVIRRGVWSEHARIPVGVEPVGLAVSADNRRLYVVNSTSLTNSEVGTLTAIDTQTLQPVWDVDVGQEPRGISLLDGERAVISLYKRGDLMTVDLTNGAILQRGTGLHRKLDSNALRPDGEFFGGSASFFSPRRQHPRGFSDVVLAPAGDRLFGTMQFNREDPVDGDSGGTSYGDEGGGGEGDPCDRGSVANPALVAFEVGLSRFSSDLDDECQEDNDDDDDQPPGGGEPAFDAGTPVEESDAGSGGESDAGSGTEPGEPDAGSGGGGGGGHDDDDDGHDDDDDGHDDDDDGRDNDDDDDHPRTVLRSPIPSTPVQGPVAAAVDPTGSWVYVVNHATGNVAVMPAYRKSGPDLDPMGQSSIREVVMVGKGPNGIALTRDGKKAYVYNSFDHTVSRLTRGASGHVEESLTVKVAEDVLPPDVVMGRKLFFDAMDSRMTSAGTGIACGTCHLEGRDDGHRWSLTGGVRETPSLAGRKMIPTAPYHYDGEFSNIQSFLHDTVQMRMGGSGVSDLVAAQVLQFIDAQPAADNPHRGPILSDAALRGAELFETQGCSQCHSGELFTDNTFADVGTLRLEGENPDLPSRLPNGFNIPSLLGVARTAPYLHDGSARTLRHRLERDVGTTRHGDLVGVTPAQLDDLVAYLKTL